MSTGAAYILKNNEQVATFRMLHPNGYTVLDGDHGIGLEGAYADEARALQDNSEELKSLLLEINKLAMK